MTRGAGTYEQSPVFAFPRSYCGGIGIRIVSGVITEVSPGKFTLVNPPDTNVYVLAFDPRWWAWSSNCWTLDYIISESYYLIGGAGAEIPMPFYLNAYTGAAHYGITMIYAPFTSPGTITYFPNPPAPPSYWLPVVW